jgi:hypothetical protein
VIYFVGEKMLKPVVKIFALVAWSLGMLLILLVLGAFSMFDSINPFSRVGGGLGVQRNTTLLSYEFCAQGDLPKFGDGSGGGRGISPPDSGESPPESMEDVDCPLQPPPLRCSQGPYGSFSHSKLNAIDVPGPPPTYWYAPSDGVITYSVKTFFNSRISWQKCGGIIDFYSPEHGVTYRLVHVYPLPLLDPERVKKGDAVAAMALERHGNINFTRAKGTCATGAHFHLEVNGTSVYADRYYREFLNCNLGSCP